MTTLNKTTRARTSLVVIYSQNYAVGIRWHYRESSDCFEYPKKSLLRSVHPKKYLPNFPTPKHPGIENFKPPKKFFDHPRHLKSGVPPPRSMIQTYARTEYSLKLSGLKKVVLIRRGQCNNNKDMWLLEL